MAAVKKYGDGLNFDVEGYKKDNVLPAPEVKKEKKESENESKDSKDSKKSSFMERTVDRVLSAIVIGVLGMIVTFLLFTFTGGNQRFDALADQRNDYYEHQAEMQNDFNAAKEAYYNSQNSSAEALRDFWENNGN